MAFLPLVPTLLSFWGPFLAERVHRQKTFGEELAAFPGCRDAGERGVRDTWDSRSRPDASPLIAGAVPQGHPAASRRCPPDLACGQDPAAAAAPVRNEEEALRPREAETPDADEPPEGRHCHAAGAVARR